MRRSQRLKFGEKCPITCEKPITYQHSNIGEGLKNPVLLKALSDIFNKFTENGSQFSAGVSSNSEESLNNSFDWKARLYGKSESATTRQSLVVLNKNEGPFFALRLNICMNVSPSSRSAKRNERLKRSAKISYEKSQTIKLKNIVFLVNKKTNS